MSFQIGFLFLTYFLLPFINASNAVSQTDLLSLALVRPEDAFKIWGTQHSKEYIADTKSQEYGERLQVFLNNAKYISQQNAGNSNMKLVLNEFADLTWKEFSSTRLGLQVPPTAKRMAMNPIKTFRYLNATAPLEIDWREKGVVTEVKNQGGCGSCWAFATTGAIESVNAIVTGELTALSEQELVDCDRVEDQGCGGGFMDSAYKYIIDNGGLDTEEDYPYWSGMGVSLWCNRRKETDRHAVTIDGFEDVPQSEEALQKAVGNQPVSVGICASMSMQFYGGGIIDSCCDELNHGVLVVGYAKDKSSGLDHWVVKNSWGGGWGEEGYFRLKRGVGKQGLCGIASAASYPIKTHANPTDLPSMCDIFGFRECAAGATCSCSFSLFGWVCLWHDCCPLEGGVTCDDLTHCCPGDMPVCDTAKGLCSSEDGSRHANFTSKISAKARPPHPHPEQGSNKKLLPGATLPQERASGNMETLVAATQVSQAAPTKTLLPGAKFSEEMPIVDDMMIRYAVDPMVVSDKKLLPGATLNEEKPLTDDLMMTLEASVQTVPDKKLLPGATLPDEQPMLVDSMVTLEAAVQTHPQTKKLLPGATQKFFPGQQIMRLDARVLGEESAEQGTDSAASEDKASHLKLNNRPFRVAAGGSQVGRRAEVDPMHHPHPVTERSDVHVHVGVRMDEDRDDASHQMSHGRAAVLPINPVRAHQHMAEAGNGVTGTNPFGGLPTRSVDDEFENNAEAVEQRPS